MMTGFVTCKIYREPQLIKKPYPDKGYWIIKAMSKITDAGVRKKEGRQFDNYIIFANENNPIASKLKPGMIAMFTFSADFHLSLLRYEKDGKELVFPIGKFFTEYIFIVDTVATFQKEASVVNVSNKNVPLEQGTIEMARGFLDLGEYIKNKKDS